MAKVLTAHQLAKQLLAGPDLPVHHSYSSGDYWRTQLAPAVERVEEKPVKHSGYHNTDQLFDEEKDGPGDKNVIVLS